MDQIQDWATYISQNHELPPSYLSYAQQAFGYASTANSYLSTLKSYLLPLINRVAQKPDLATIALLLIILFISLKILNMLFQTVMFWFRMARRLVFWGGLVGLAVWMYTRGPEGAAQDLQYWYETWMGEYQHWKEQERVARLMKEQQAQFWGRGQRWY